MAGRVFTMDLFPDNVSGVVIAGFGEDDYLPEVVAFDVEGVLLNFVKVRENADKTVSISGDNLSAAVVPFAQGEMVQLFMEGIDPSFRFAIGRALADFIAELADIIVSSSGSVGATADAVRTRAMDGLTRIAEQFTDQIMGYSRDHHIDPVISAVGYLPREELAAMAESLVSLTSFKRRVTRDPETVGGPIDVAVISKGDGFIWIHRKNYFDPALNQHFFANYYRTPEGVVP